VYEDL
jgi:hypothetical protein